MTQRANDSVGSSDNSSHDSRDVASRYHQTDGPSINEEIRRRAFEIYIERGKQPSDGMADWLQAEREYHERS